jgi:hypothetical protein
MDAIVKAIFKLRDAVDPWLRQIMFPNRKPLLRERDSTLRNMVDSLIPTPDRADAELELDTRDWLREFWSRSFVAWIALVISIYFRCLCGLCILSPLKRFTAHGAS